MTAGKNGIQNFTSSRIQFFSFRQTLFLACHTLRRHSLVHLLLRLSIVDRTILYTAKNDSILHEASSGKI